MLGEQRRPILSRGAAVVLTVAVLLVGACGADEAVDDTPPGDTPSDGTPSDGEAPAATPGPTISPVAPVPSTTPSAAVPTAPPTAGTTVVPTAAPTVTAVPTTACGPGSSFPLAVDVDGDRVPDLVVIEAVDAAPVARRLVVCTAAGRQYSVDDVGMVEVLHAVDLDGDGVQEIEVGGTTAWGVLVEVVSLHAGVLDRVRTDDGMPLVLTVGMTAAGHYWDHGCVDVDGDGRREIVLVEGELVSPSRAQWTRTVVEVAGHSASVVRTDSGGFDVPDNAEVLTVPDHLALIGGECN